MPHSCLVGLEKTGLKMTKTTQLSLLMFGINVISRQYNYGQL